jgi:Arc/MetJ-type ribon-helix-helix transcriptional regulator
VTKDERITIRFSEETLEEVDDCEGSRSENIREAVRQYLKKKEGDQKYADEQLLGWLRELAEELDRTPTKKEVARRKPPSRNTYNRRFGSFGEAVRRAGLHFAGYNKTARDRVREYLAVNPTASVSEIVEETEVDLEMVNRVLMERRGSVAKADGGERDEGGGASD